MRVTNNVINFKGREIFIGSAKRVDDAYNTMKEKLGNTPVDYQNINPQIPSNLPNAEWLIVTGKDDYNKLVKMRKAAWEIYPKFYNIDLLKGYKSRFTATNKLTNTELRIGYYQRNCTECFGNKFNKLHISGVLNALKDDLFDSLNLTIKTKNIISTVLKR